MTGLLRMSMAVSMVFALALCIGCGRTPGAGLLTNQGIPDANQVQYVIYQTSTWTTPQPQLFPLNRPLLVTDRTAIEAFYDALNHPAGGLKPKTAPNARVGFVAKNGRVVIFAVGGSQRGCESCDANLAPVTRAAFASPKQRQYNTTAVPSGALSQLSYHTSSVVTLKPGAHLIRVEKAWRQLLSTYNPLSLRGNVHCTQQELKRFLAWVPEYVEVRVKKPVTYQAIVVPPDLDPNWPPKRGDNRSNLKTLEYDTVYVARLPETRKQFVRFVFLSSRTGDCLATDAVDPRAIINYAGKFGQPTFGSDLFSRLVSDIKCSSQDLI